jgi:hypothetical protein
MEKIVTEEKCVASGRGRSEVELVEGWEKYGIEK